MMEELRLKIWELINQYDHEEMTVRYLSYRIVELFDDYKEKEIIDKLDEILSKIK